jgi:putative transposase
MSRRARLHYPGAVYHVMLRGSGGQPLFYDDTDRHRLYLLLREAVERFDCRIHGFCLMTDHIHLIVQTGDAPLSHIMQSLSLRYTKWINGTHGRTGHVFQGRYKALLLDADTYLTELVRYLHLHPVRTGVTACADDYCWSSHHAYQGKESLPWLTTDRFYSHLPQTGRKGRQAYERYMAMGRSEARKSEFHEGLVIGNASFREQALRQAHRQPGREQGLGDIINAVCRRYNITAEQLKAPGKARPYSEARALAALLVQETPGVRLSELGRMVGRDLATLGRAGRRLGEDTRHQPRIAALRHEVEIVLREA